MENLSHKVWKWLIRFISGASGFLGAVLYIRHSEFASLTLQLLEPYESHLSFLLVFWAFFLLLILCVYGKTEDPKKTIHFLASFGVILAFFFLCGRYIFVGGCFAFVIWIVIMTCFLKFSNIHVRMSLLDSYSIFTSLSLGVYVRFMKVFFYPVRRMGSAGLIGGSIVCGFLASQVVKKIGRILNIRRNKSKLNLGEMLFASVALVFMIGIGWLALGRFINSLIGSLELPPLLQDLLLGGGLGISGTLLGKREPPVELEVP